MINEALDENCIKFAFATCRSPVTTNFRLPQSRSEGWN